MIDEKREKRQLEGIDRWEANNYIGILDYAPGVGKTYSSILAIKRLELEKIRYSYVLVVPSDTMRTQWKKNIETFPKHLQDRLIIKTVNELLNDTVIYQVDCLIIDEIHEFHTDERLKIIDRTIIKYKMFLGLTGTSSDKTFRRISRHIPIVDVISIEEAKEKGFISDFIEYNLAVAFTKDEQDLYEKFTDTISRHMPKFNNNLELANKILFGGKDTKGAYYSGANWARGLAHKNNWNTNLNLSFPQHREIDNLWNPNHIIGYAKALVNAIRLRKQLIYCANSKYDTTLKLVKKMDKVKTIVFSESIDFTDNLYTLLEKNKVKVVRFHSKLKTELRTGKTGKLIKFGATRLKKEALTSIESGTKRVLVTTRSLDTGTNIPDLRFSITTSGTQSETQNIQRRGRSTRKEISIDAPVLLVNLYVKDTQEEKWLNSKQYNSTHKIHWITAIDEISYTPPNNEFSINDI